MPVAVPAVQVRSCTLDTKVWEPPVLGLFRQLGNTYANAVWEGQAAGTGASAGGAASRSTVSALRAPARPGARGACKVALLPCPACCPPACRRRMPLQSRARPMPLPFPVQCRAAGQPVERRLGRQRGRGGAECSGTPARLCRFEGRRGSRLCGCLARPILPCCLPAQVVPMPRQRPPACLLPCRSRLQKQAPAACRSAPAQAPPWQTRSAGSWQSTGAKPSWRAPPAPTGSTCCRSGCGMRSSEGTSARVGGHWFQRGRGGGWEMR